MGLTIFQRAHVWALDNADEELRLAGAKLGVDGLEESIVQIVGHGFSAITVKLLDGHEDRNTGLIWRLKAIRAKRGIRFIVGGWSQLREDAVGEAQHAHVRIAHEGAEYWEPSGEFEYKGEPGSTNWNRSSEYVSTFRHLRPSMTLGFVSMPNEPAGHWFDWAAWRTANARWVPECYPNEFPNAPTQWPEDAQRVGNAQFFKSYTHPLLGLHGDVRAIQYIDNLRAAKAQGFTYGYGVWSAHYLSVEDWKAFSTVNLKTGAAGALAWHP